MSRHCPGHRLHGCKSEGHILKLIAAVSSNTGQEERFRAGYDFGRRREVIIVASSSVMDEVDVLEDKGKPVAFIVAA